MNRLLWEGSKKFGLRVASLDGGSLRNAIPRESFAIVVVNSDQVDHFKKHIAETIGSPWRILVIVTETSDRLVP